MVYGAANPAPVAMIFDTESRWALDNCQGPRNCGLDHFGEMQKHYDYFWQHGINVDVLDCGCDFSGYRLVIAPMLYMYRG
ncbi:MAG: beta-galactosidase trimerization domain-containing protein, partial [Oscillospiraceae bacterium]